MATRPQLKTASSVLFHDNHDNVYTESPVGQRPEYGPVGGDAPTASSTAIAAGSSSQLSKPAIPGVHSDATEYYGGAHVSSRARTYSSVRPRWFSGRCLVDGRGETGERTGSLPRLSSLWETAVGRT